MSAPIGPYVPPYPAGWHNLEEPNLTTPITAEALNELNDWLTTIVNTVDATSLVLSGDISPIVATAVAAYLAANPTGAVTLAAGYLALPGVNGSYAQCPDVAGIRVTGDIDVRWYGTLGALTSGGFQTLVNVQSATATSWMMRENSAGNLQFSVSSDGTTIVSGTANAATPAAAGYRATWVKSTGVVQFFKLDPAGSVTATDDGYGTKWTQIGANRTASTSGANLYTAGGSPLTVGAAGNGTAVVTAGTVVSKVTVRSGIDGTLVASPTFAGHSLNDLSFADASSNVWTIAGTATIVPVSGSVVRNGTTLSFGTPGSLQAATGGTGWKRRNPVLGTFKPSEYGDLVTSDETRRAAVQGAIDAAYAAGGGVVDLNGPQLSVGANSSLNNQVTGLPYASILAKDNVRLYAEDPTAGGLILGAGANCHLIGHPGRLNNQTPKEQDNIPGFSIRGLLLDGNKANQDGCHDHDGLRFPQFPRLRVEDVVIQNCDGHGYYSSANGDFAQNLADIDANANATLVKPLWLQTVNAINNARWGFMMSATNRKTHEKDLNAIGNGTAQARVVGKKPNPVITANGTLALTIDSSSPSATVASVSLLSGDTAATVVTKINAVLGSTATAALSTTGRLMITSATTGGVSWVGCNSASTTQVLADLGLALTTSAGPLPAPLSRNGDNNDAVGACEYGGFYADHSEAGTDHWFADSNIGMGVYVHNVQLCDFGLFHAVNNNGIGVYVQQLTMSGIRRIISGINCLDPGYASYLPYTLATTSGTTPTPKTEVLFGANSGGYGVSNSSSVSLVIAPGSKLYGPNPTDNRKADASLVLEHGIASSLTFERLIYGDGGLNADGLGATIRDYR